MSNIKNFKDYLDTYGGTNKTNIILALQKSSIITREYLQDYTNLSMEIIIEMMHKMLTNGLLIPKFMIGKVIYEQTDECKFNIDGGEFYNESCDISFRVL